MKFLSQLFDFMFAPAGTFDSDSGLHGAVDGSNSDHVDVPTINPATCLPMIEGSGIDVGGSPFGTDIHHHDDFNSANDMTGFNHGSGSTFDTEGPVFDSGPIFDSGSSEFDTGSQFD